MKSNESTEQEIDNAEILMRLELIRLIEGRTQREQVRLMNLAGLGPTRISELLGTTTNTVNVALSTLRKEKRLKIYSKKDQDGDKAES